MKRYGDREQLKTGRGPNGRLLCRWCGTEVERPRRTWCSDACVDEWMVRSSNARLRSVVFKRDGGICALCGLDTGLLERILRRFSRSLDGMPLVVPEGERLYNVRLGVRRAMYEQLGFIPDRTFWEADHIVPVVRGGGSCGLDNIRTLCRPCHVQVTRELAAERARERRDSKRGLLEVVESQEAQA